MPVPVWNSSDLEFLDVQPLDSTTVVSEDIWKKFDLDSLDDHCKNMNAFDDYLSLTNEHLAYEKKYCSESREIRHHDCMWAGLCISKEHNRTLPAKKPPQIHQNVAAGRSLLISYANNQTSNDPNNQDVTKQALSVQKNHNHNNKLYNKGRQVKALESDGDSARSETPPSSSFGSESEEEDDDEIVEKNFNDVNKDQTPMFRHDQISINERLSECMSDNAASRAVPIAEVTGQFVRKLYLHQQQHQNRRKSVEGQRKFFKGDVNDLRNTLSDHSYHLNQPTGKELEYLGLQTPSDTSDEEIDVVTFEKPCRPTFASLPTNPNIVDQQYYHQTHLYRRHHYPHHHHQQQQPPVSPLSPPASVAINTTPTTNTATTTITPKLETHEKPPAKKRGRPPMNPEARKHAQQQQQQDQALMERTSKRVKNPRNSNKYNKRRKSNVSSKMTLTISRSSSEDDDFDEDEEKRSLHNNMERQRRIGQRLLLEKLRLEVPAVKCNEKAAKVAILKEAKLHVAQLRQMEAHLKPELNELMKQRRILVAKALELGLNVKPLALHCATDPGSALINRKNKEIHKKTLQSDTAKRNEPKIKSHSNFNKRFHDSDDFEEYHRLAINRYAKKRCHE